MSGIYGIPVPLFLLGPFNQVHIASASGVGGAYLGSTGDSQGWLSGGTYYSGSGNNWVVACAAGDPVVADLGGGEFTIYAATGLTPGNNWDITTKRVANFHADLITFDKPMADVKFGTVPSLSGIVRFSNNALALAFRNAANNADIWGIYFNASNEIIVGDSNGPNAGVRIQNHAGGKIGFFGTAPAVQPGAYTQTYSTAARTQSALTGLALSGISTSTTGTVLAAPSAAYTQAEMQQNFRRIQDQFNNLLADHTNTKQVLNALIDDHQSLGLAT